MVGQGWDRSNELKSKTGKSLFFVFGMRDQVRQFDHHHTLFKDYKYQQSAEICNNLIRSFKNTVVERFNVAKIEFCSWEKEFFVKNLREAVAEDISENILNMFTSNISMVNRCLKYGNCLVKLMQIFYLFISIPNIPIIYIFWFFIYNSNLKL